ncbi:hypothetical protein CH063_12119 [Colletotrichum higginsianum]|uniref:Uncharacterized protein n=1 Tax=Colletotrichum higginsianum (strain IMI 349063) TaxID=759273 RepID=H1VP61_COLHI|nr:hypothetical protein CH063_12119 [Colletotrichum higginsianum]
MVFPSRKPSRMSLKRLRPRQQTFRWPTKEENVDRDPNRATVDGRSQADSHRPRPRCKQRRWTPE